MESVVSSDHSCTVECGNNGLWMNFEVSGELTLVGTGCGILDQLDDLCSFEPVE
jgi:hypothetical protein